MNEPRERDRKTREEIEIRVCARGRHRRERDSGRDGERRRVAQHVGRVAEHRERAGYYGKCSFKNHEGQREHDARRELLLVGQGPADEALDEPAHPCAALTFLLACSLLADFHTRVCWYLLSLS